MNIPANEPAAPPDKVEVAPEQRALIGAAGGLHAHTMTIADRVRSARMAANKTQQQLAGETYSKSYISAVERGKMTPSVQALAILAERLGLPVSFFLGESEIDLSTLAENTASLRSTPERERQVREDSLNLLLGEAEGLIRRRDPDAALGKLGGAETLDDLSVLQKPRWYALSGWALLLKTRYHEAIAALEKGLNLAEQLRGQAPLAQKAALAELAERLRCFLGNGYYEMGQPEMALEYHRRCLLAASEGGISDPELKLRIYLALGHDYLLLGRYQEAIGFYKQASNQATEVETLLAEGSLYWSLGLAYKDSGDLFRAKTNMQKALVAFELQENMRLAAQLRSLFGQVLVHLGQYEEAEVNLRQSLGAAERTGDTSTHGAALGNFATMHNAKGEYAQAIETAQQGLAVVKASQDRRTEGQLHLTLSTAYEAGQDYQAAEQAIQQAMALFEQTGDKDWMGRAHEKYGKFLADRGRFEEAYDHMRLARAITARKTDDL